ncbi:hypothetical protein H2202_006331 [Exophiala xenobiotica]|nr:hypothetical protein H2202_006331 [Exophiala xenobiotica]
MVEAVAEAGVSLIGIVGRNQKMLDSTKIKHATQYPDVNIATATADVTDATRIGAAFSEIRHIAKGPIDILISNAGYQSRPGTITGSESREMVDGIRNQHCQSGLVGVLCVEARGDQSLETFQVENPDVHVVSIQPGILQSDMSEKAGAGITPQDSAPKRGFFKNKFVWANWDVDEMKARANRIQNSPVSAMGLAGWPVLPGETASGEVSRS